VNCLNVEETSEKKLTGILGPDAVECYVLGW